MLNKSSHHLKKSLKMVSLTCRSYIKPTTVSSSYPRPSPPQVPLKQAHLKLSHLPPGRTTFKSTSSCHSPPLDIWTTVLVYIFLDSESKLGRSKEFNNKRCKVLANTPFLHFFFLIMFQMKTKASLGYLHLIKWNSW